MLHASANEQTPGLKYQQTKTVTVVVLAYTVVYLAYLWRFVDYETELAHWLTLVILPLAALWITMRLTDAGATFNEVIRAVGFTRDRVWKGILWGVIWGLILGMVQTVMSNKRDLIWEMIKSGAVLYRLPMAFILMLLTAGFTEEFFFRGILQSALARHLSRKWLSVIIAGLFFGMYHFPYAYLKSSWPSHGDVVQALTEGVIMSAIMGFILGAIYARTRHLIAPIICHALFNAVWAMTISNFTIRFG